MKDEPKPTPTSEVEEQDETEPRGVWLFTMLADLGIGPTVEATEISPDEK